jgi:MFS family permease
MGAAEQLSHAVDSNGATHTVQPYPSAAAAWYTVAILFMFYWLSILDRLVISLLVKPIRQDLHISDFELSLLQGFAFGVFYAICGLPLGWLVDRASRRKIIYFGVTVWSFATFSCGLARNYFQLFLSRVGVGAGEASLSPAAYSLLADSFPPQKLTLAVTVFGLGSLIGTGMAYALGGMVVELAVKSDAVVLPLFGEVHPWQLVFMVIGLPGVLLAWLAFSLREPVRRLGKKSATGEGAVHTFRDELTEMRRFIASHRRFFVFHHTGFTMVLAAITGFALWYPAYMSRAFGWSPGQIGLWLGLFYCVGGLIGAPLTGWLIDRLFARGVRDAHMRVYMCAALLATPVAVIAVSSESPWVFLCMVTLTQICIASVASVGNATLQIVAPSNLRGRFAALYLFISILMGIGLGPSLIAAITDFVFHDDNMLGASIALVALILLPLAALMFRLGQAPMRAAVDAMHARA